MARFFFRHREVRRSRPQRTFLSRAPVWHADRLATGAGGNEGGLYSEGWLTRRPKTPESSRYGTERSTPPSSFTVFGVDLQDRFPSRTSGKLDGDLTIKASCGRSERGIENVRPVGRRNDDMPSVVSKPSIRPAGRSASVRVHHCRRPFHVHGRGSTASISSMKTSRSAFARLLKQTRTRLAPT